jgi:hypothetical protein
MYSFGIMKEEPAQLKSGFEVNGCGAACRFIKQMKRVM